MNTKEIDVDGRKFKIRELLAIEFDEIDFTDKKQANKKQVMLCSGISEDEYNKLTFKERLKIMDTMNELNGVKDFQVPIK